jgi:hypothetical protein
MKNKTRLISKSKSYGFNPWVDQVDAINQIMEETGETVESVTLRTLVDEALAARRQKSLFGPATESGKELAGRLQSIESLLMRLLGEADTSFRIQDLCLALLQDVLTETHATHRISWDFVAVPRLREEGIAVNEIEHRFKLRTDQARELAYGLAERIRQSQESEE